MDSPLIKIGTLLKNGKGTVGLVTGMHRDGHQYDRFWTFEVQTDAGIKEVPEHVIIIDEGRELHPITSQMVWCLVREEEGLYKDKPVVKTEMDP